MTGFLQGLRETGFVVGRDIVVDQRWADGNYDRVRELAAELTARQPKVIFASGNPAAIALKKLTATIPVVFTVGIDPVKFDFAKSMSRPAGNMTGTLLYSSDLVTKRLEMLKELHPGAAHFAYLVNSKNPNLEESTRAVAEAAKTLQRTVFIAQASTDREIEDAFGKMKEAGVDALVVSPDAFFADRSEPLVALAARYKLPTIYDRRNSASSGGLIAYGPSFVASYYRAGVLVGRILKGEKAGDLPIELPTKFELVVNLKTAKTLGLDVPPSILARADEVIE
jgi:putative ABC transport system substrate-binding protein